MAQGRRSDLCGEPAQVGKLKSLEDAGISHQQASDWERLAAAPQDEFETALANKTLPDLLSKPTAER
jgi:hypothetical protein